ncbi:MAG: glycosyltransferase family 39 protein [Patescibacteria group bacterium]
MKKIKKYLKLLKNNKIILVISAIFLLNLFTRTYQLDIKNPFGYDQVDNAWAAMNIIVNHKFPLVGMVAKANSGVYVGPLYYYIVSFFYFIFNLNPIASQAIAVFSGIFTFWMIFIIFKKLLSLEAAIIALLLNSFSFNAIMFDRVQWPVQLLPTVSLLIFHLLYKITLGDVKKIIPLSIAVGFSFSLHFTSIFFSLIILFSLPLFPRTRETLKYGFIAISILIASITPNIIYLIASKNYISNTAYFSDAYHGFHLRRMSQLIGDALIQFDPYILLERLKPLKIILVPLFFLIYLKKNTSLEAKKICYLIALWFLVPWVIFSLYSGEISDYYFAVNRFIALLIIVYFINLVFTTKFLLGKIVIIIFILGYSINGLNTIISYKDVGLYDREKTVKKAIREGREIGFQAGVPESYVYYYLMRKKGIEVYGTNKK